MRINKIKIHNYRNLDGLEINFHKNINFIVGENNIGKSNFLELLKIIFKQSSFREDDFCDTENPIEIEFSLELTSFELGHFSDLFDPNDNSITNIICRQLLRDEYIQFYHKETNTSISRFDIRGINFIYYDSIRNPIYELTFDKKRGVGRFLTKIISSYLLNQNIEVKNILNSEQVQNVVKEINLKLNKLEIFKEFAISADVEVEPIDIFSKIIALKDAEKREISHIGYGVQFLLLIVLSILEQIDNSVNSKRNKAIFEHEGEKYISLVLGLDEPEIHLHPYMQRSLIKYLNSIISNNNEDFQNLIKELWGIDGFDGQIIIATHSPNIILNDYRQIIRFYYSEDNAVKVVSGQTLTMNNQEEKHIYLQFPFIKEAFFSKCVIFVEGDSELGALSLFADKMGIDLDEYGIAVIKTSGKGSMNPLINVVKHFKIKALGVKDRDNETEGNNFPIFLTTKRDFEEEIISKLFDNGNKDKLREILVDYDNQGENRLLQKEAINNRLFTVSGDPKYSNINTRIDKDLKLKDCNSDKKFKYFYLTWILLNKSITLGHMISEKLEKDEIPDIYKTIINKAVEMVRK